jgi:hypothetical protein
VVERGRTLAMGIESGESVVGATWQVGSTAVASTAESGWMVKGDGKAGGEAVESEVSGVEGEEAHRRRRGGWRWGRCWSAGDHQEVSGGGRGSRWG